MKIKVESERSCRYHVFARKSQLEGDFIEQFGIVCTEIGGTEIQVIEDISEEYRDVKQLEELLNDGQADPCHFMDIVEDFLIGD